MPNASGKSPSATSTSDPDHEKADANAAGFGEQIRLVHFTLIITCAVILIALYSDQQDALGRATQQLDAVRQLDDVARRSYNTALTEWLINKARPVIPPQKSANDPVWKAGLSGDKPTLIGAVRLDIGGKQYPVNLEFEVPFWRLRDADGKIIEKGPNRAHETQIKEFQIFWDRIVAVTLETAEVPHIVGVYDRGLSAQNSSRSLLGAPFKFVDNRPFGPPSDTPVCVFTDESLAFLQDYHGTPPIDTSQVWAKVDFPGKDVAYPSTTPLSNAGTSPEIGNRLRDYVFAFMVTYRQSPFNSQLLLANMAGLHLPPGNFDKVFPDLASVTSDLAPISLTNVAVILHRDLRRSPEIIELLGLKLPIQWLAGWGTIAILALQLYLWLHLRELRRRSGAAYYLDTAWIGLYPNSIAHAAFILSACAWPPVALVYVGRASISGISGVMVFGCVVTVSTLLAVVTFLDWYKIINRPGTHGGGAEPKRPRSELGRG